MAALSARYADQVEIRAGVCNPDKADKLKSLANVTVVQATMGDEENLTGILKGVDALHIVPPSTENRAQLAIVTAEAAKTAGVKHVGVVSVTTARLPNTIFGGQFAEIESTIGQLGVPYTFVRLPFFAENFWGSKATILLLIQQNLLYWLRQKTRVKLELQFSSILLNTLGKLTTSLAMSSPITILCRAFRKLWVRRSSTLESLTKRLSKDSSEQAYQSGKWMDFWSCSNLWTTVSNQILVMCRLMRQSQEGSLPLLTNGLPRMHLDFNE